MVDRRIGIRTVSKTRLLPNGKEVTTREEQFVVEELMSDPNDPDTNGKWVESGSHGIPLSKAQLQELSKTGRATLTPENEEEIERWTQDESMTVFGGPLPSSPGRTVPYNPQPGDPKPTVSIPSPGQGPPSGGGFPVPGIGRGGGGGSFGSPGPVSPWDVLAGIWDNTFGILDLLFGPFLGVGGGQHAGGVGTGSGSRQPGDFVWPSPPPSYDGPPMAPWQMQLNRDPYMWILWDYWRREWRRCEERWIPERPPGRGR